MMNGTIAYKSTPGIIEGFCSVPLVERVATERADCKPINSAIANSWV
ncbi:uncharacterized protein METZ01_LOCUS355310 [marine metagenome]|uniref:Uncharacterized protein n=1 Tax=marine metagenome TaxID=408172 RepID=A0A382RXQ8_9ZZZZ